MQQQARTGAGPGAAYHRFVARALAGLLVAEAKNGIRRMLGRPPLRRRIDRLAARHWGHLVQLRPIDTLAVSDFLASEGPGSRALMSIYTMAYCRAYGLTYRHTPFRNISHADRPQDEWDRAWEAFLNLGQGELPAAGNDRDSFDLFELNAITWHNGDDLTQHLHPPVPAPRPVYYFNLPNVEDPVQRALHERQFVDLIMPVVPDLRDRYRVGKTPMPPQRLPQPLTVAVHIRRGDVLPDRQDMWTALESFAACLDTVSACLRSQGREFRLQIFSEGQVADFALLERFAPHWHLDSDPLHTLGQMIEADILVMSKSSFSYVAALLSEGIKIFEPCPVPPLDGWIMRSADGRFDPAELSGRLASRSPRS